MHSAQYSFKDGSGKNCNFALKKQEDKGNHFCAMFVIPSHIRIHAKAAK